MSMFETAARVMRGIGASPVWQIVPHKDWHLGGMPDFASFIPNPPLDDARELATQFISAEDFPAAGTVKLTNHGNSVISNPKLINIYAAGPVFSTVQMDAFSQDIMEHGAFSCLESMGFVSGQFWGSVAGPAITGTITTTDMENYIRKVIASSKLPQPDGQYIYNVFLSPGSVLDEGNNMLSCTQFCGVHWSDGNLNVSVVVNPTCSPCIGPYNTFDACTSVVFHEIGESITDRAPGQGWYVEAPNTPYDGMECGDVTAWPNPLWSWGPNNQWHMQPMWTNTGAQIGPYVGTSPQPQPQPNPNFVATGTAAPFWQFILQHPDEIQSALNIWGPYFHAHGDA